MKRITLSLTILLATYTWIFHTASTAEKVKQINPVIGDESFVKKFGYYPDGTVDERVRIKTHLEYVENLLRNTCTDSLPPAVRQKRMAMLNYLTTYRKAGVFPQNDRNQAGFTPCYIDKKGRICALGYLIEKSAGRHFAQTVYKHCSANATAADTKQVNDWIQASGLTWQECTLIQPLFN